jgi:acid phosphatase type 7
MTSWLLLLMLTGQPALPVPEPAPAPPRRPYVQHVTPEALSLLWETPVQETSQVTLRSLASDDAWARTSGPAEHHEVRFEGLVPAARYEYTVRTTGGTFRGEVRTAPAGDQPFTFLVYGDTRNGHAVHPTMIQVMAFEDADFVIHTGDFVSDGVRREVWTQFLRQAWPLMRKTPLYPTVGNHENTWDDEALDLYRRIFAVPGDGPRPEEIYTFTWGNSRFFFLDSNRPFVGAPQAAWLRAQLREAAADPRIRHLFVGVHQSAYSSGPHGPNLELQASGLVDDLRRHGVALTFSAHDHLYERGRVDGLNYVISAGGGAPIYFVKKSQPHAIVLESVHHYCRVEVAGDRVTLSAFRMDGSRLDHLVLERADRGDRTPVHQVVFEHHPSISGSARETPPMPPPPGVRSMADDKSRRPIDAPPPNGDDAPLSGLPWLGAGLILAGLAVAGLFLLRRRRMNDGRSSRDR